MNKIRLIKKIFCFLDKNEKISAATLVFAMCIGAVLETAALSLLVLLSTVLTDLDRASSNKIFIMLSEFFSNINALSAIILLIALIILTYIIKAIVLFLINVIQYRFIFNNQYRTQQMYLTKYFKKPYEFFLLNSTSRTLRIVSTDIPYIYAMLNSFFCLCSELIISMFLFGYLLYVSWLATIIIVFFTLIVSLSIYLFFRTRLIVAGEGYKVGAERLNKWILQGIDNIKEIKVMQQEDFILSNTEKYGKQYAVSTQKRYIYMSAPKIMIESMVVVVLMCFFAVYISIRPDGFADIIPTIVAMIVASIRLLPSISRMNSYINDMNYMVPFLDSVQETIDDKNVLLSFNTNNKIQKNISEFDFHSIDLKGISFKYFGTQKWIFKNANFHIDKGDTVGIVGKSGSGKTTLVDILIGLLEPENGKLYIDDKEVGFNTFLGKVGYIPQKVDLIDGTIKENIAFGIPENDIDYEKLNRVLKEAQLESFINELPNGIETSVGERGTRLSGGQCQRIGIARALYTDASLLVFDEATSALDNGTENLIIQAINDMKGKITMIIIAHRLQTIENCDYVYEVVDGDLKRK